MTESKCPPRSVTQLAKEFAEFIGGPDKYRRFDVWYLCFQACVQIYQMAPTKDHVEMTRILVQTLKDEFGIDIKGLTPNNPAAFQAERERIDRELLS